MANISKKTISERYEIKETAINTRLKEMKALRMYGDFMILDECFVRVDEEAFDHYMRNRYKIRHNLAFEPFRRRR